MTVDTRPGHPTSQHPTWRDRLVASDPGSVRIALATRAAASLVVVLAAEAAVTTALGLAGLPRTVVLVLGAVLTMMTIFTASDPTTRGRLTTQLCLPVAMLAGIVLSTLVDRHRVLSLSLFVVVMFVVVWVRRFGPRGFACGMVAWMGYFISLFLQLSFALFPAVLVALGTATVVLLVLSGVVAPQRPRRRLLRMVDSFRARVLVERHAAATDADRDPVVALLRVNETAVLVDGQLAVPHALHDPALAPDVRAAVLRVEVALDGFLAGDRSPATATAVDAALDELAALLAADDRRTSVRTTGTREDLPPFTPGAELFAGFLPGSAVTVGSMHDDGDGAGTAGPRRLRLDLTTRQAFQIALAGGLAIVLGDAVSGQRWYWAVLACFLAFTGTATAAETVTKALQRTVGTAIGVAVALVVVPLLGASVPVVLLVMMVALFVGFYLFRVSYTSLAFAVTVLVAELYQLMGTFSDGLMLLRVGETLLGALIGGVVALAFLPAHAHDAEVAARARLAETLRDGLADVATALHPTPGPAPDRRAPWPDLHERLRALDAGVHQLALIGVPRSRRLVPDAWGGRSVLRSRLRVWVTAAVRVRAVVAAAEDAHAGRAPDGPRHPGVTRAARAVSALADDLVAGRAPAADRDRAGGPAPWDDLAALHDALVALHEIDGRGPGTGADPATPRLLPAALCLRGTVRAGGEGGDGAVLTLVDAHGRQHGRARAAGGRYEIEVPHPGVWQLIASAPGHRPRADRLVLAGPDTPAEHDVVLTPNAPASTPASTATSTPVVRAAAVTGARREVR